MIIIIQAIVIVLAVVIIFLSLGNRKTYSGKAWKKIGLILLALSMIIAVIFPDTTNDIAHLVGVGRGADLILYGTVIAFIFYALNNYLHQQDQRDITFRLARKIALVDAIERYKINKK